MEMKEHDPEMLPREECHTSLELGVVNRVEVPFAHVLVLHFNTVPDRTTPKNINGDGDGNTVYPSSSRRTSLPPSDSVRLQDPRPPALENVARCRPVD